MGSASGAGVSTCARRQVDLRPGIAQVALADAVVQVDDAMEPRVVLDGELAELRVDRELIAESLVELLDLVALARGPAPTASSNSSSESGVGMCCAAWTSTTLPGVQVDRSRRP